ncbi:hypothetical protein SY83_00545 [Paenibacillus swuensis]|uniref:HTH araC/xylS-type domain-containing protein n=1 Tax=Paenibacillus swuensis TaxID=1178515 RepID=A0A172TDV9_9BACL|nr:AraC family transcriptional regulator [Paenibacillus swuensis]ANE45097.1 hypothetical protein SY83_00545 [Paenibacillus swuensis]
MKPYFEQNKNQSGDKGVDRPFYVGYLSTEQEGYSIPPHWHYHVEIIYMALGCAVLTTGSQSYELKEGDMVLIHPCEVHSVTVPTHIPSLHYVVGFDPELLRPMPNLALQFGYLLPYAASLPHRNKVISTEVEGKNQIRDWIEEMHDEYRNKAHGFELAVTSMLYKLVVWMLRQGGERDGEHPTLSIEDPVKLELFRKTLVYLNENCHEQLSATDVAQISMMSYSRFAYWFKQLMQTSLTSYILFLRLRKAEQLLLNRSQSITEIALESGFNSPSYFIKHFKRAKGVSPMQYRKQMLQHTETESLKK